MAEGVLPAVDCAGAAAPMPQTPHESHCVLLWGLLRFRPVEGRGGSPSCSWAWALPVLPFSVFFLTLRPPLDLHALIIGFTTGRIGVLLCGLRTCERRGLLADLSANRALPRPLPWLLPTPRTVVGKISVL